MTQIDGKLRYKLIEYFMPNMCVDAAMILRKFLKPYKDNQTCQLGLLLNST